MLRPKPINAHTAVPFIQQPLCEALNLKVDRHCEVLPVSLDDSGIWTNRI